MIEILILFSILKKELTMYGIQKAIADIFNAYSKPSFGAIKPALRRLERSGFVISRRTMSEGGKQSGYYLITNEGQKELKRLLLEDLTENPVQFFSGARIKISCASVLSKEEVNILFEKLKMKALEHKFEAENILNDEYTSLTFYQRVGLDNAVCEYQNFVTLIESLEKENAGNS
ncbi:PadR family transcriptional regulator [bacterium]|nr:PadR family transcriptional regulator [bacterium]